MAVWRKGEVGAAKYCREKREATIVGNVLSYTEA